MTRPRMLPRAVRVDAPTWEAAQATADLRNEILSEQIRKFLVSYARKGAKT